MVTLTLTTPGLEWVLRLVEIRSIAGEVLFRSRCGGAGFWLEARPEAVYVWHLEGDRPTA